MSLANHVARVSPFLGAVFLLHCAASDGLPDEGDEGPSDDPALTGGTSPNPDPGETGGVGFGSGGTVVSGGTGGAGEPDPNGSGGLSATGGAVQGVGGSSEDPDPDPTSDPECETGIIADGVCCAAACGACGGPGCGERSGGAEACCRDPILATGTSCADALPPCVMGGGTQPPDDPGEGNILLHATFQSQSVGTYARADVVDDFGSAATWDNGLSQGRASVVQEGDNRFLRVNYPANQYGPGNGGVQFEVDLGGTYSELYFSYRVRFADGFNFMKGGKLPGLVGGTSPSGCTTDKTGGFSARNMWRTGGNVEQYLYYPDRTNNCGDDWYYKNGATTLKFDPGTWHTLEHRVVMGTVGETDGLLQAWFDGELALDDNLRWKVSGATYGIDALYFSTFFGGGDSSWAPPSAQQADFDDFIVSDSPITH